MAARNTDAHAVAHNVTMTNPDPLPTPPAWLDEVEGDRALDWVRERNAATEAELAGPHLQHLEARLLEVLDSPDRIPFVRVRGTWAYNFWTDADHPRGLWRRQDLDAYLDGGDDWDVLVDVDALSTSEGHSWVWHGASVLYPDGDRALIDLSEGGSDADTTREFDITSRTWVTDGFTRSRAKGSMSWIDRDSVWVANDFGPGTVSTSGYPLQVRLVRRGQDPADAPVVVHGDREDLGVGVHHDHTPGFERSWAEIAHDFHHSTTYLLRDVTALSAGTGSSAGTGAPAGHGGGERTDRSAPTEGAGRSDASTPAPTEGVGRADVPVPVAIDVPSSADVGAWREWLLVALREDWELEGRTWAAGSLLAFDLEDFLRGSRQVSALFEPDDHTFLETFTATRHHLVLTLLSDVTSRLRVATPPLSTEGGALDGAGRTPHPGGTDGQPGGTGGQPAEGDPGVVPPRADGAQDTPGGSDATQGPRSAGGPTGGWALRDLDLRGTEVPPLSTVSVGAVAPLEDDRLWLTVSGFTTPTTLALLELSPTGTVGSSRSVRRAPELFDPTGVEVSQHFATSQDGTRIPYFQVGRPGGNPTAPTLLYGYGGFEVSLLPHYAPGVGRALLEQGGTYVVANIRGGGEYGPAWHRAALREHRHRAYEDFAAVAQDLVGRGVTTPSRLGIQGGSNGGLLTGNMVVREPGLFGAAVVQVPLLDMRRYHTLLAGASWMAEYGDPDDPEQWESIREFSPFHLFDPALSHPPVLITTSTRDDRVHPAHARTMAWRMLEGRADVLYFENTEGGHAGAADNAQRAHVQALVWEFLRRRLGD